MTATMKMMSFAVVEIGCDGHCDGGGCRRCHCYCAVLVLLKTKTTPIRLFETSSPPSPALVLLADDDSAEVVCAGSNRSVVDRML